jgi:uncharacterized protein (TIGR03546 family)
MIFLKLLSRLVKILKSGEMPSQIAWGFVLGMVIGFISLRSLLAAFFILLVIILDVNISAAIFAALLFRAISYFAAPLFHTLGYWVLVEAEALHDLWGALYSIPFIPYTRFNNTVVMGSLVVSVVIVYPVFAGAKLLLLNYRKRFVHRVRTWKVMKILGGSKLVKWFARVRNLGGWQ